MTPKLIEPAFGAERTREIPLQADEFLIGRGPDCDLRVAEYDVSRHHCLIRRRGSEVTLVDLGSANGTYVNGQRVLSQAPLHSGDEITLGKCRFIVDLGDRPEGVALPPVMDDPLAVTTRMAPPEKRHEG